MRIAFYGSLVFTLISGGLAACGGRGINPAMQGKEGMLSQTAIAKKCEEAKEGHDRPFIVEWDATDLASFEVAARQRTMFVKYEGCSLKVLYECRDPNLSARFGAYGTPEFASGTLQGFDIKNQGELYAKLPLGAASLSGRLEEGESLHLKYFVTGVATNTRESIYRNELSSAASCEGATHFVWGYNLGAFELDTTSKTAAEAEGSMAGVGAAGAKGSREQANVGRGGEISSCSTQDQRGCRVPIRLSLRPIRPGDNPLDKPGAVANVGPGGAPPGLPAGMQESLNVAQSSREAITEATKLLNESQDGVGCLKLLDKALALDPRNAEDRGLRFTYPRCLMRAGKCDEGMKRERELLASEDPKRILTDANLDSKARNTANMLCPSSTAKNKLDLVLRSGHELSAAARAKNTKECKSGFEKVLGNLKAADEEYKVLRESSGPREVHPPSTMVSTLSEGVKCIAETTTCAEALPYHKRQYCHQLHDMKGCEKTAQENWDTMKKLGHLTCK